RFAPLDAVFLAGGYADDIERQYRAELTALASIGGAILVVTLVIAWLIDRDISHSLNRLEEAMARLAKGENSEQIARIGRGDEVGEMAQAVAVFREHMVTAQRLAAEQEAEQARAEHEKHAALVGMADNIEHESATALDQIGGRTDALVANAEEMTASANR